MERVQPIDQTEAGPASRPNRVFISHSSKDAAAATVFVAALEARAILCWIAPRDVSPGMRYGEAIIDGINGSSLFVLLLSPHSNASPQVLAEVERAVSKGLSILTIRLEDVALTKSLEYFLSSFHWIDAFAPFELHLPNLVEAVGQNLATRERTPESAPQRQATRETPNNLPHQLTSFIGREHEIADVAAELAKTRLLTLTGSGGTGKTRLSLQVASALIAQDGNAYADGIWFVELAPLSDPALVPQTVADALGVREVAGTPLVKTLGAALLAKRLVLILDNGEHVLAACAALASELLRVCPGVKIVASSREPLSVPGETVYRVPPLSLPDPGEPLSARSLLEYEAVRLFAERARSVRPDFAVADANAAATAQICRRLDGIPLAIELAAARVRSLSVEEVSTRLDHRFRLLTGGSKTLLPRQQTLRALIDWSYDLLTDQEKTLLCRLSVFAGGWALASAESVCAGEEIEDFEVLDVLTALVDKSLVVYADAGGIGRYRLLETVRQYAGEHLEAGDGAQTRSRHRDFFLALAEEARPRLHGPEQEGWLSRLDVEYDNLREALTWCETEAAQEADAKSVEAWLRLGVALRRFWDMRGYYGEGRDRLRRALERTAGRPPSRSHALALDAAGWLARGQSDYGAARALVEAGMMEARQVGDRNVMAGSLGNLGVIAYEQGDLSGARALYDESLVIYRQIGNPIDVANLIGNLGMMSLEQGDAASARALLEESLILYRQIGDQSGAAGTLNSLGLLARDEGDHGCARALFEESLEIFRRLGDVRGAAVTLTSLGCVAQDQGDARAGRALFEESLGIFRQAEDRRGIAYSLGNLGVIADGQGDRAAARAFLAESLGISRQVGDQAGVVSSLEGLAGVTLSEGDGLRAARIWGAAESLREKIGTPLNPRSRVRQNAQWEQARALAGEAAFAAALAQGAAMTSDQAADEALRDR